MSRTSNDVLSAFPYFGGKAKMSRLICDMLDYDHTSIYIEPYGGGCRTLLNKQRHSQEIYNDFGYGLTTFMSVMTDSEKTQELIERLYDEPPCQELFSELLLKRMETEDRLNTSTNAQLSELAWRCYKKYKHGLFRELRKHVRKERYEEVIYLLKEILDSSAFELEASEWLQYEHYKRLYENYWSCVGESYNKVYSDAQKDFEKAWNEQTYGGKSESKDVKRIKDVNKENYARECALDAMHEYTDDTLTTNEHGADADDIDVAFTIFQLYQCSRDAMGEIWSDAKNENINRYYKSVKRLEKVSERMQGVTVMQCNALDLVKLYRTNEEVMMYLDPSYLNPTNELQNLGKVYKMSYEYDEHEKLLQEITKEDTKARILISNYDVELYNTYLYGWNKTCYETFTGIGSKKNNKRVEVLWKNY